MRVLILAGAAVAIIAAWHYLGTPPWKSVDNHGGPLAEVRVPDLSAAAQEGRALFDSSCSGCHGTNARGVDGAGPPLVHRIYEPSHHGDLAFQLAVAQGVRQHHWRFGDMPPVPGVRQNETAAITQYVRELQRANGIE